ncbi:MAG TPA: hypothetical protein VKT72_05170 [Candidatus Baltobacteraceae bacterium]|nr:hypothetical protein [Candidatus Baltobacteraceae bacterium]
MEKQPNEERGLLEDDDLDQAIADADDTGMVRSMQQLFEEEEIEHMPPPETTEEESQ